MNIREIPISTDPRFINLINRQIGRITVKAYAGRTDDYRHYWKCLCQCGKEFLIASGNLLKPNATQSCGCLQSEVTTARNYKHGSAKRGEHTPEYEAYVKARQRCNNPSNKKYYRYGERGIEFRFESFNDFFAEVGIRPSAKHSLNRIDNDGHYETGNVEWASPTTQSRTRGITRKLTWHGETRPLGEWTEMTGIAIYTLGKRIKKQWCSECTLTVPTGKRWKCNHLSSTSAVSTIPTDTITPCGI